jgi:hypothetical protein
MRFATEVEPNEPMRGLEVPPAVVAALGGGARPRVVVTLNGHSWSTRVAVMRGRNLIGLSNANRAAASVATGDHVEVEIRLDTDPIEIAEPDDLAEVLRKDPAARAAFDRLTPSRQRQLVRTIESAKQPDTRARRIERVRAELRATTP